MAAEEATSHVGVTGLTGNTVEPLPPGCRVPSVQGRGERDPTWVIFFEDDAISVEVQRVDGAMCKALTASLADAHFQALGKRGHGEDPLVLMTKIVGLLVNTNDMKVGLPQRKLEDLRQRLASWSPERRKATVREVLSLGGNLHRAAYFVHRLLRLAKLHIAGKELRGGGDAWGRLRKNAGAERGLEQTPEIIADVGWWRWFVNQDRWKTEERLTTPFFRFGKENRRDGGTVWRHAGGKDMACQ